MVIIFVLLIYNNILSVVICPYGLDEIEGSYKKFKVKCKSVGSQSGIRGFKSNFHNKIYADLLPKVITLDANSKGYLEYEITAVLVAISTDKNSDQIKTLIGLLIY